MITVQYSDGGTQKSLELLADSFSELRPVMGRFSRWMREEIQAVFDSEGDGSWPERSKKAEERFASSKDARIARIEAGTYNSLRGALRSERRRAERRLAKTPTSNSKLTESRRRSVRRYELQLAELERISAGSGKDGKGFKKLYERAGRREERAQKKIEAVQSGQLLGQIANSLSINFDAKSWEMFSRIPWAGAQNEGAVVGNGATLPARTFLEWTPRRIEKFVEMANEYVMQRADKKTA